MSDAYAGTWAKSGMIHRPVIADEPEPANKGGRPPERFEGAVGRMVDLITWTPETLRAAHAAYERGNRDVYVVAGNRVYNQRRMAKARRSGLSGEDRRWAERNAVQHSWFVDTRTNRCVSLTYTTE
jgi:hypothetical protein